MCCCKDKKSLGGVTRNAETTPKNINSTIFIIIQFNITVTTIRSMSSTIIKSIVYVSIRKVILAQV